MSVKQKSEKENEKMMIKKGEENKALVWEVQTDLEFIHDALDIFIRSFCETMPEERGEARRNWIDGMYFIIASAQEHLATVITAVEHINTREKKLLS